jgi:hypothetical protein
LGGPEGSEGGEKGSIGRRMRGRGIWSGGRMLVVKGFEVVCVVLGRGR